MDQKNTIEMILKKLKSKKSTREAIKKKCLDCTGYQLSEVKICQAYDCSIWPYRKGPRAEVEIPPDMIE